MGRMHVGRMVVAALVVVVFGGAYSNESAAVTIIDDRFDDGDIITNSIGVGTGFNTFTQADNQNPSTVTETGGMAVLSTGISCGHCISAIRSKDSFNFLSADGARVTWSLISTDFDIGDNTRNYLAVYAPTGFDLRPNPNDTNAPGVYVRLEDPSPPPGVNSGFQGGIVVEDGTGAVDELATWSWFGVWDRAGGLNVVLNLTDTGFNVGINGNLGNTNASGSWSSIASATNFISSWESRSAVVAAQNQGLLGIGSMSIDRMTVEIPAVPEPETYAMMLVGIGLVGWQLRRKRRRSRATRLF